MTTQTLLFKLQGMQATPLSGLAGKSYTVSKVTSAGKGLGLSKWLFLTPTAAGKGTIALKLEGGKQAAGLAGLTGKTVSVGKSPTVIGGVSKWLVLQPDGGTSVAGAMGAAGAVAKGKVGSDMVLMKLDGIRQATQLPTLAGKSFTVVHSPIMGANAKGWLFLKPMAGTTGAGKGLVALQIKSGAGKLSGLVGKNFCLSKAPMAAGNGAGKWILMKPTGSLAAKGAMGAAAAAPGSVGLAKAKAGAGWKGSIGAGKPAMTLGGKSATAAKSAAAAKSASSGTIWTGSGWKLGLGLGLGSWGPVLLGGALAAAGYGVYQYYQGSERNEETAELAEAIS